MKWRSLEESASQEPIRLLAVGSGHATDQLAHRVSGPCVHPEPAECGQRQHRGSVLGVGLDE